MAKEGKKTSTSKPAKQLAKQKKLAKQAKRALRAEADKARFQRSDRKSLSEVGDKTRTISAITPAKPMEERSSALTAVGATSNHEHTIKAAVNTVLAQQAAMLLSIAAGIGFLFGLVLFGLDGGREAVAAMGGVLTANAPPEIARIVFALDILFPVFFGSGLAVFATSLQSRGNRPLVRLILTALLVAVSADFIENALAFKMLAGEPLHLLQWPATVLKYASLAFAGVMISTLMPVAGFFGGLAHLVTRYVFPIGIALLVSGIGGEFMREIVGASFPISLLILALYASILSDKQNG